jgi:hypothetical protein
MDKGCTVFICCTYQYPSLILITSFECQIQVWIHYDSSKYMRGETKVMPPIFFITYNDNCNKIYIMDTSFTKLRLFCHKVSFIINTLFLPFHEML